MFATLKHHLRDAMRLTLTGRLDDAARVIQQAMSVAAGEPLDRAQRTESAVTPDAWSADAAPRVLDGFVLQADAVSLAARSGPGEFVEASYRDGPRLGQYKLYVPPSHAGRVLPLVVMLHGCTQDADDFALGTGMNERAREQGFFVLYPQQSRQANPSRCWNWFKPSQRRRGSGEPALIAGMTRLVMQSHGIDAQRVYLAGLSAGGAMAAIVAAAYPELYAAVGVHSGLPGDAADGPAEAVLAMVSTGSVPVRAAAPAHGAAGARRLEAPQQHVPTIVFHGDLDAVVHPSQGERVIAASLQAERRAAAPGGDLRRAERGQSPGGRSFTRTLHLDDAGTTRAEHWLVHGAGHAWSGGHTQGSYTDPAGPDASREMLRFFAEHPLGVAP